MNGKPYREYGPTPWRKAAALLLGLLFAPFILVRFLLKITLFLGARIRKVRDALLFTFRSNDIFIVTYPKSGTTWLQMILYQMTTDGDMDFEHISKVSPWYESLLIFPDPKFPKMAPPRLIKSHLPYRKIPKTPCKYIYVTRDGRDAMVSAYHQIRETVDQKLTFPKFFQQFMRGKIQYGSWFKHVYEWRRNARRLDVLHLTFEDLKRDPAAEIRRVADFCGIELDDDRLNRVLERSSFAFMREHETRFGPEFRSASGQFASRPGSFIRSGETGGWKAYFDEDMRQTYNAEQQKWFGAVDQSLPNPTCPPRTPETETQS